MLAFESALISRARNCAVVPASMKIVSPSDTSRAAWRAISAFATWWCDWRDSSDSSGSCWIRLATAPP